MKLNGSPTCDLNFTGSEEIVIIADIVGADTVYEVVLGGGVTASFSGNGSQLDSTRYSCQTASSCTLTVSGTANSLPYTFTVTRAAGSMVNSLPSVDYGVSDTTPPSGYSVSLNQDPVTSANQSAVSFTFAGAETGTTYNYTITSSGGGTAVTGSGTINAASQTISGINVSGLGDGTLTLSATLTDSASNTGTAATDTTSKDTTAPSGYSVSLNQDPINSANQSAVSFTFAGAEIGASYNFTLTSSGGGPIMSGSGTITATNQTISGIYAAALLDGTLTLSVTLTDSASNTGTAATDTAYKDATAPSGYSVALNLDPVTAANESAVSFTFAGAVVGTTYNYTITSSGGGTAVTGSGTITTTSQAISSIDVSGLGDGTLTLSATLTDSASNTGTAATDTVSKDATAPSGYSVALNQDPVTAANESAVSFTFAGAETGTTYNYTISSSGGGTAVTGSGTITTASQTISSIDASGLGDGTLTLSVTLTDSASNTGTAATDTTSKDAAAPSSYSVSLDQNPVTSANESAVSFTFAGAETGTTYNYTISSSGGGTAVTGSGTITTASQTISSIDASGLGDGTLTLSVTLTDSASNTGTAATDTTSKDATAPSGYSVALNQDPVTAANESAVSFTFAGAETGTTYNYTITSSGGGTAVTGSGTITTASQTISSIDASGLGDGTLTLSVTLTDSASNTGTAATDTTSKDAAAPSGYSVALNQDPVTSANESAVSFTFAGAETGTTYDYTITSSGGGTAVTGSGTITTASQTISSIDASGLGDGTLTLSVTLTDSASNTGTAATDTTSKDVSAPAGYSVALDQNPVTSANESAVSFTFAGAETGTTYNYTISSSGGGTTVTGSGTITTASQTISSIDVSGLGDGTLTLSVTLTDSASNTGTAATDTTSKDATAPSGYSVSLDQNPVTSANESAVSFTFAGAETGTSYDYTISSSGGGTAVTGSGTITTASQTISGINVSGLGDGTLTLSVTLTDSGNTGTAATDTTSKDVSAPSGYSVSLDQNPVTSANQSAVSFTFAGAETGTTYDYAISSSGGGTTVTGSGTISAANQQITGIDVSGLGDGTLTLSVTLTDSGNTGTAATDTASKDVSAPSGYSVSLDQDPVTAANESAVSFTFAGAETGTTYNYTITSSGGGTTVTGSGTINAASQTISSIDVSGLGDGTLTLSVTLTDSASNTGTAATDTTSKDVSAPSGYSVSLDQDPVTAANESAVSFTFAGAETGTTYNYSITSSGGGTTVTGSGTITTASQTISSIDVSGLGDGTLTLSVTLTDSGNTGTAATDTASKDVSAPSGYSVALDQDPVTAANESAVSFTFAGAETGTTYNYTISSSGGGTTVTGSGTITTASQTITGIDVSGLGDGTLTLSVTLTDSASNTGTAATDTASKDVSAPSGYSVSLDQDPVTSANESAVSFTFAGAVVGTTYDFTITSSGGGTTVTGSGTITTASQTISSIDVSGLGDGTLTLSVTLTDSASNTGAAATDTASKDVSAPSGYSVSLDQDPVTAANESAVSFTFAGAVVGTTYDFTITSSGGGTAVTGSGTITTASQTISSIDVSGLGDGTLTLSVKLTDSASNTGAAVTDTASKDVSAPSGYSVSLDQDPVTAANESAVSFTFAGAVVGTTYDYTISSSGGGTTVTGSGTITMASQTITGIDVSGLMDGTLTLSVTLTDSASNTGAAVTDTATKNTAAPSGYTVSLGQEPVTSANQNTISFSFAGAAIGTTYHYTITSSGGGTAVTGSGTISAANQQITGIDVSGLGDGTLTLSVTLTDSASNIGVVATATIVKNVSAPSGYSVSLDQDPVTSANESAVSFTFAGAVVGTTYNYTISSSGGGTAVTGSGTITAASQTITGIDVSGLGDGTLTLSATLTDSASNTGAAATDTAAKDVSLPTTSITGPSGTVTSAFSVAISFSKPVNGLALSDVTVEQGSVTAISGSGASYSATIDPIVGQTVRISVAAGVTTDSMGNPNLASNVLELNTGSPASEFESSKEVIRDIVQDEAERSLRSAVAANQRMTRDARERFIRMSREDAACGLSGTSEAAGDGSACDDGRVSSSGDVPFGFSGGLQVFDGRLSSSGSFFQQNSRGEGARRLFLGDLDIQHDSETGSSTATITGRIAWERLTTKDTLLGYFFGGEIAHSSIEGSFDGHDSRLGLTVGGYAVKRLAPGLYLDGFITLGAGRNNLDIANDVLSLSSDYTTRTATLGTALSGVIARDGFEIRPELAFSYGRTWIGTVGFTGRAYGEVDDSLSLDAGTVSIANLTFRPEFRVPLDGLSVATSNNLLSFAPRLVCERVDAAESEQSCGGGGEFGLSTRSEDGMRDLNAKVLAQRVGHTTSTSLQVLFKYRF
ncbi:hypothetical protein ACFSM0_04925 [Rhodobacter lacus]|uniref:Uncharacterized protein n=2 Tax=Rhodobacter lacus TaxID=1641972 RepID=A0ABW5A572_9RHOB